MVKYFQIIQEILQFLVDEKNLRMLHNTTRGARKVGGESQ